MIFTCPKCKQKLNICDTGAAVCPSGHSYDRAREGYYNLLLSRGGGTHGDNADMVKARCEFLDYGYYKPMADAVSDTVCKYLKPSGVLLDAGLGEGYYTEILSRALSHRAEECGEDMPRVVGFDISRDAVRRAAKRRAGIELAVASSYDMPFSDGSVDLVVNIFSPLATDEVKRVLSPGGAFVMVIPGKEHLFELKAKIYDTPYKNTLSDTDIAGFELVWQREIKYNMSLGSEERIRSLFMMTPYAYRTSATGRERVLKLSSLNCTAHFHVLVYKRVI